LAISKQLVFDWAFLFQWIVATTLGWVLGSLIFAGLALAASGVFIGAFQAFILKGRIPQPLRWALASAVGWLLGYLLVILTIPPGYEALYGVGLGSAVGIAQWLVLRRVLHWTGWWIPFSIMGWVTGLVFLSGFLLTGTMVGVLTGVALEILLRNPKQSQAL
jgi:hypothetical protein